jgi:enolase-phosphatase E1
MVPATREKEANKMIAAIVMDIEGTTTDINFVHQTLFPYARRHLEPYITANYQQQEVQQALLALANEIQQPQAELPTLLGALRQFMAEDRKSTALKTLQGLVWFDGYQTGQFKGHLYPDVVPALNRWQQANRELSVYSSGSVAAQKLLFSHSIAGDISGLFSYFFDTRVGAKREVRAYQQIAKQLGHPTSSTLFLSDIKEELDAARSAGWQTIQLIRDKPDRISSHQQVNSFADINLG